MGEPKLFKMCPHVREVLAAPRAQVVGAARGAPRDLAAAGLLAVQDPQRVLVEATAALLAQVVQARVEVRSEKFPVPRAVVGAADRVHPQEKAVMGDP